MVQLPEIEPQVPRVTPTTPDLPLIATQAQGTNEALSLCTQLVFPENPQDSSYLTDISCSWESLQSQPPRQSLVSLIKADSQSGFQSCSTTRQWEKPRSEVPETPAGPPWCRAGLWTSATHLAGSAPSLGSLPVPCSWLRPGFLTRRVASSSLPLYELTSWTLACFCLY